jgi:hypothetical protein
VTPALLHSLGCQIFDLPIEPSEVSFPLVLRAMIAEVEKESARRLIPLSKERAAIERVEYDRG